MMSLQGTFLHAKRDMEAINIVNEKINSDPEFTTILGENLTENEIEVNLDIGENEKFDTVAKILGKCSELDDHMDDDDDDDFVNDKLSKIVNTSSCDNMLSATAAGDCYLSEDDEFDLQKIKHEALYINYSSNFKNETSIDLDYDCTNLNVSTSFDHPDIFMHEEVFSENYPEIEMNHNDEGVPLDDIELCKENTYDNLEEFQYSSVLSDHNYIGQEINIIHSEQSIKNSNDLKNYSAILNRFINDYEKSPEINSKETEILIEEMSSKLNTFKNTIKNKPINNIENIKDNDLDNNSSILNDNTGTNEKNIDNDDKTIENNTPSTEIEMESLILSENCSEPLEYPNNLLETDNSKNELPKIDSPIFEKISDTGDDDDDDDDDDKDLLNKISKFGLQLVDSCKEFNTLPSKNAREFLSEKFLEFKKILFLNTQTVSVQTDYSGKIYSERRLKKINDKEKFRLLEDSSSSNISTSDDDNISDSDSYSSRASEKQIRNDEEIKSDSESIKSYNGIDLSQYIDEPLIEAKEIDTNDPKIVKDINSNESKMVNDITENCEIVNKEQSNSLNNNKDDHKSLSDLVNNESIVENEDEIKNRERNLTLNGGEDKDEIEEREINRLLDFKSLANKKVSLVQYVNIDVEKSSNSPKRKPEKLLQMMEYSKIDELSDGSLSDVEDNLATEKEFLVKRNEDLKQSLLNSSSSDSDTCSERMTLEKEDDDSNTSLVMKFLETYDIESENENENNNTNRNDEIYNQNISNNHIIDEDDDDDNNNNEINNNNKNGLGLVESNDEETKITDSPEVEKQSIFDKAFIKKPIKEKSFESLLTEDERRRKYSKYNEELISLSSEESEVEENKTDSSQHSRILRPMIRQDQLASETKVAQKEENGRISRLKTKETMLKKAFKDHKIDRSNTKELILDYDLKLKKFIKVHPDLFKHLKQHQIEGIKFMYDACYGSVNSINEHPGSGCILAHCMGLGKTLQLITLLHTVISNKQLKTSRILVLCPKSTVMNWADEIQRWLAPLNTKNIKIFTFNDTSDIKNKLSILREWASSGQPGYRDSGCLLIGYEAFRTLVSYHTYRKRSSYLTQLDIDAIQKTVKETLLKPGADLVVCDEGHIIKNRKAAISQAVTEITTPRRIVLTGTPIQNNLKEYYSMVNFIKPSFLGTEKEFANLYTNPIRYGQHKDSSKRDIKIMKQRSFVLHKKLSSFVQRREAALLKTFLPEKFEYVLFIPLTKVQSQLYGIFLESVSKRDDAKGRSLLTDYTCLRKIWTHPKVLENAWLNATMLKQKKEKRNTNLIIQSDDDEPDDIYDSQTGLMSVTSDWWRSHLTKQDLESIIPSNKLQTMFEILKMCEENREKCLIFSAFVAVLNVVEYFMQLINSRNEFSVPTEGLGIEKFKGPWVNGKDYYRLDGKTPKTLRHEMVKSFNNPANNRARVFLISAKAGGQGINLIGANRVLILDTSWNPSNDQQNIFRIFRLGQTRKCFIYRLIALGTMEEKVYSRSVTKQAMSFRVVDEHQIDRHYNMAELAELYDLTQYGERPVPPVPKEDSILATLLRNHPNLVYKYHEHDSLLENKIEQELSEQEKEDAWLAYEQDTNYNNAITGANIPPFGRFDVFGNQVFIPPMDYSTNNNLSDMSFNQRALLQNAAQQPFLPTYGFPGNDSYLDSMYKMYQNAQNYSSSLLGMDAMNTQSNISPRSSSNLLSNTSNPLSNFCNTLSVYGNPPNIANDINSINQPHYGTSMYAPSTLNPFCHSSLLDNLKKIENYTNKNNTNSNTGLRIQKPQTPTIQNNNPFQQSSFITNDNVGLSGNNSTPTDAIPTSVIMKNDLLLKQFNDQIKSAAGTNNRYNLINKTSSLRPIMNSGKPDSINSHSTDIPQVQGKKRKLNEKTNLQSVPKQNYISLIRSEEQGNTYKQNVTTNSSYISGLKSTNVTELKDKNNEDNSVLAKSSGIFLIENQPNSSVNKTNEQIASNIPVTSNSLPTSGAPSRTVNFINKPHTEVTNNNNFISSTLKNPDKQTSNTQNTTKTQKLPINVEPQHSNSTTSNMRESNIRIKNIPKANQSKQIINNEKLNNNLTFNTNLNQNLVITKVQDPKRNTNILSQSSPIIKKTSDIIQTGKNTFRNTTISNLMKGTDKSIVNKFLNSDLSITPTRNRITNTSTINQISHVPETENVTLHTTKQSDQRKRSYTSLKQSTNFTNEMELHKRQKLTGVSKTEINNRTQNNYKM